MRYMKSVAVIVGIIGLLALASFITSSVRWTGGYPAAEFRLQVHDSKGQPIPNAEFRIYDGGTRHLAFNRPINNHVAGQNLLGDANGVITAVSANGMQFGGHTWWLFWLIPIGAKAPPFDCEITAPGYEPLAFPIRKLSETSHQSYDEFPKTNVIVNGEQIELPIYEHTFTLER